MRRERTDKEKLYLKCGRRTKCTATLSLLIANAIRTEKTVKTRSHKSKHLRSDLACIDVLLIFRAK